MIHTIFSRVYIERYYKKKLVDIFKEFKISEKYSKPYDEYYNRKIIERIYEEKTGKTIIQLDTPKSKKSVRNIPISNKLYDILVPLKRQYKDEDFFLTGDMEKFVEPRNYQYIFKDILKKYLSKFHNILFLYFKKMIQIFKSIMKA